METLYNIKNDGKNKPKIELVIEIFIISKKRNNNEF